jgi:hypothetical protein
MSETIVEFGHKGMMTPEERNNLASILEEFANEVRDQKDYAQSAEVTFKTHLDDGITDGMRVEGRTLSLTVHFGKVTIG